MQFAANSFGARIREFNACHAPETGQFCSTDGPGSDGELGIVEHPHLEKYGLKAEIRLPVLPGVNLRQTDAGFQIFLTPKDQPELSLLAQAKGEKFVGHISLTPGYGKRADYYDVTWVDLDEPYRGKGIASVMYEIGRNFVKANGAKGLASGDRNQFSDPVWDRFLKSGKARRVTSGGEKHRKSLLVMERLREQYLKEFNPCHAPDTGQFCSGTKGLGGTWHEGRGRVQSRRAVKGPMRTATDAERKKLGIPPAYTNARIATDPKAELKATALTPKGEIYSLYSKAYTDRQTAAKWARVAAMHAAIPQLAAHIVNEKTHVSEAMALRLIMQTGLRNGGSEGGGEVEAFGASNLRTDHVTVDGPTVRMQFPGKHGVAQDHSVTDPVFANWVRKRQAAGKTTVFDHDAGQTLSYLKSITKGKFKVHDLRTWYATVYADQLVQDAAKAGLLPKTKKEYKSFLKAVSTKVGAGLGNKPGQALKSYIHPAVFAPHEVS